MKGSEKWGNPVDLIKLPPLKTPPYRPQVAGPVLQRAQEDGLAGLAAGFEFAEFFFRKNPVDPSRSNRIFWGTRIPSEKNRNGLG